MTTCLGKLFIRFTASAFRKLLSVYYLVMSLLVLTAGCGNWLYRCLIIAYHFIVKMPIWQLTHYSLKIWMFQGTINLGCSRKKKTQREKCSLALDVSYRNLMTDLTSYMYQLYFLSYYSFEWIVRKCILSILYVKGHAYHSHRSQPSYPWHRV